MDKWTPEQLKTHLDQQDRVFLKLWKKGCGACKLSEPALERIEAANAHKLVYGQIDVSEYPQMLDIAETDVLPCFFVFAEQKMKGKLIGFKGIKKLEEFLTLSFGGEESGKETSSS
jgi:hypothetical protein